MAKTKVKRIFSVHGSANPNAPYAHAVIYGNMVFVSGQGPLDPNTHKVVKAPFAEQAKLALTNLKTVLKSVGSSMDHMLTATVALKNKEDWEEFNEIYKTFIKPGKFPARISIEGQVPSGKGSNEILVGVQCVAHIPEKRIGK